MRNSVLKLKMFVILYVVTRVKKLRDNCGYEFLGPSLALAITSIDSKLPILKLSLFFIRHFFYYMLLCM